MELYQHKNECCGCGACATACPKKAITMIADVYGFYYPVIDFDKCVGCGKCIQVCAFKKNNEQEKKPLSTYVAVSKNDEILGVSTSGGAFAEIAKRILQKGGVVFGCAYTEDFLSAKHIKISSMDELKRLQGSKYIQSDTREVFTSVKACLEKEQEVLFSGTPCQVASLRQFLGKEYPFLYCVDVICHGVGAPALLAKDIQYLTKGEKIKDLSFRDKKNGWGTLGSITTEKRKIKFNQLTSTYYYYYYLENALFRDSCYHCRYPSEKRVGDITLGDYWRVESAHPEIVGKIDVSKGVSCVLVNTEKGKGLIEELSEELLLFPSEYKKIERRNGQLVHCCAEPSQRTEIFELFEKNGYEQVVKYCKKKNRKKRLVLRLKSFIPRKIKILLKKKCK